jgi:phosphoribosylformylglycinamidine synthase
MLLRWNGEVAADIPLAPLADEAPLYERPHLSPDEYKAWAQVNPLGQLPECADPAADLLALMGSPDLASRRWIWEQYDHMVGADTVQRPGGDAAVVRVHGGDKAIAISTDVTPRYCFADPCEGGKQAIAECYRNLSAVGAAPLAVTNCLNFANPQRPEIMAQLVGCLEGMSEACRALDFPIVSGNVSLYNESKATGGGSAILPTPAIGGIGLLPDWRKSATIGFQGVGDVIVLIGERRGQLGQSLWLRELHGREDGRPPSVDLPAERRSGEYVRARIASGCLTAVHDVADGGVAVAVAEMALAGGIGALLHPVEPHGVAGSFFAEDQGLYVATVRDQALLDFLAGASAGGIEVQPIGRTIASRIIFELKQGDYVLTLKDLRSAHEAFFLRLMGREPAVA